MRVPLIFACACVLASCSDSGNDSPAPPMVPPPSQPIADTSIIRGAVGGQPLAMGSEEVESELVALRDAATVLRTTDRYDNRGNLSRTVDCIGDTCRLGGASFTAADLDSSEVTFEAVMTHNGLPVFQGARETDQADGGIARTNVYGAWMANGAFWLQSNRLRDADGTTTAYEAYGATLGDATGDRLTGSGTATWSGIMLGFNLAATEGYHGDAAITVNFADADVDVAFTNIHELFTGAVQSDITFSDVPMTPDGFASGARPNNRIAANFYGVDHAEVGGIFEHDDVLGAFGAKKDE